MTGRLIGFTSLRLMSDPKTKATTRTHMEQRLAQQIADEGFGIGPALGWVERNMKWKQQGHLAVFFCKPYEEA